MTTSLNAQLYRAQATDIDEVIYHLYSSDLYPCLALSNQNLYKIFGKTTVKCELPAALNLNGKEHTILVPGDKEIFIANPNGGATVINFSDPNQVKISEGWGNTQLTTINFDKNTHFLYSNSEGVFRKHFSKPPVRILDEERIITSSAPTDDKGNFIFADLSTGIYGTYGDSIANIFSSKGVTAVDFLDQTIYMNQAGSIKKLSKKGGIRTLATLPDKYKSATQIYYDNDYNIWVQSEDLFAFNLTDDKLYKVHFEDKDVICNDAITKNSTTYIATNKGLYTFQRTLDRIIHSKTQEGLPLLYSSGTENILVDNGDLYTINRQESKQLSSNTKVKHPIKARDGWWIRLDNKLLKVNDRSIPPLIAPSDTVTVINTIDPTTYAIGTTEGIFIQGSQETEHRLHTLRDTSILDLISNQRQTLVSSSPSGMHSTDLTIGHSLSLDSGRYCPALSLELHNTDTIAVCSDALHILRHDTFVKISAQTDLHLNEILDIEFLNEDLYILGNNQLLKGDYGEIQNDNIPMFTRYQTYEADRGLITYQNGQLLIETPTEVSIIYPNRLTTHVIEPETEPSFTYEYDKEGILLYDQKSSDQSQMKYESDNGEWVTVANNNIPYKTLSGSGLKVKKKNLYGEWIPLKVKPINMVVPKRQSKLGWIFISLGLLALLFLLKRRYLAD